MTQNGISYGLYLTAADNGQTWSYYPPDGYDSAILDGGSTSSSTGIKELITIDGASQVTINGLQLQHFRWVGIGLHGGGSFYELFPAATAMADSNTITNNIIHDGSYDTSPIFGYGGGAFYSEGNIPNTTVTNNAISNISTSGIEAAAGNAGYGRQPELAADRQQRRSLDLPAGHGLRIDLRPGQKHDLDEHPHQQQLRSGQRHPDVAGQEYLPRRRCLRCDRQSTTSPPGSSCGRSRFTAAANNTISSNIVDMGPYNHQEILLYQGDGLTGMTGNTVRSNLIVSGGGRRLVRRARHSVPSRRSRTTSITSTRGQPSTPAVSMASNGDASPVFADPQLSCWTYDLASGSPVYSAPVSFVPLPRGWGPPGYTIPATGTPPSQPHSC